MNEKEFLLAFEQAPPSGLVEFLYRGGTEQSIPRAPDRVWRYRGTVRGASLDWSIPCVCDPRPDGRKVICQKVPYDGGTYFVGTCRWCGVVNWLQKAKL